MKKCSEWIKGWFMPQMSMDTTYEIHTLNIKNIYYVSLVVGIVQTISLVIFLLMNMSKLPQSDVIGAVIRVGLSVLLCIIGFIIAGRLLKNPQTIQNHLPAAKVFIGGFIILLIIWSMFVSVSNYVNHQQLLTFYTVELITVLFVRLHPLFTAATILGSYLLNYLILNFGFGQGGINPYNYIMLAAISVAGAVTNYQLTINYIAEKNKANLLNNSLELIANHDSITRLQNRYALNQRVSEYVGTDICIAMGDINNFKGVNDTYGHQVGDDVLKLFSDILLDVFPKESVYRFGGDEFLVVEKGDDPDVLKDKLRKVNEEFSKVNVSGVKSGLGCSFGCVTGCPKDPGEFFDYLTQADKLLYLEKEKIRANR